jgi:hypothetical protein
VTFILFGEVTNQGSQKATFVKVSGAFYNSSNAVVAADFTYTDPQDLEPGQTAPFDIIVNTPTANKITSASVNVGSNQYSSINSQVVQVSPNVKSSSTTTTVSHSSSSTLKLLSISIRVAHDPISRGSTQTVFVKVSDKGNSSKPVSGANVDGKVIYASHETTEPFSGITDSKGEMSPSHSWQIGGHSNPGIFRVNVHASAKGYKPASATTTFNVAVKNTTNVVNTTITNTTTIPENNTSSGDNDNSTSGGDNNNTSIVFNPLIPSSGNSMENGTDQQEQTLADTGNGGENITADSGGNENDIIPSPNIGGGNFSDTGAFHPHDSSKRKDTTVGDEIGTPPDGGSNNGVGSDGNDGNNDGNDNGGGRDKGSSGGSSGGGD